MHMNCAGPEVMLASLQGQFTTHKLGIPSTGSGTKLYSQVTNQPQLDLELPIPKREITECLITAMWALRFIIMATSQDAFRFAAAKAFNGR